MVDVNALTKHNGEFHWKDGPAFPVPQSYDECGMTLRDHFAAKALPAVYAEFWRGVSAHEHSCPVEWPAWIAVDCYRMADAMLAAREEV